MSTTPLPSLVGDVILGGRELMTDLPSVLAPPTATTFTLNAVSGNPLLAATYFFLFTFVNQWGETLPTAEVSIVMDGSHSIQITGTLAPGITARAYVTASGPGLEVGYVPILSLPFTFDSTVDQTPPFVTQPVPTRNTAYLPDSDGAAVGAFAMYRWLNQALAWAAAKNRGGLPDFGAAATTNAQPNYVMPGYWRKIDSAWFDGYPLGLLYKNNVFRRNPVPGFSGMLIVFQATDRLMIEAWPQPNRTSNVTTLAATMTSSVNQAQLTSVSGQVLGFGLYQIGSEIVNYAAVSGNFLIGLMRGMCGTTPVAHAIGETCTELNLMIAGYRVPSKYAVGSAASTFFLPPGWDEALTFYLVYRFRKAEQDEAGAAAALKEATDKITAQGANRIIAGPRQISPYAAIGPEVGQGLGTAFGGVIIP